MASRSSNNRKASRIARQGVTLLELLIVITILAMVTAATIPLMLSGVDQRKTREAARLVSTYIAAARSRAIETGRTAGVMIQRSANGLVPGGSSMNLVTVETPPLYAGDTTTSTATVAVISGSPATYTVTFNLTDNTAANVHVFDVIRFNYQGQTFFLSGNGSQTAGQALPTTGGMPNNSWSYLIPTDGTGAVSLPIPAGATSATPAFQVTRQPIRSAVTPLQLPEGTVIDLVQSGWGMGNYFAVDTNPIVVTFTPVGAVDEVFYYGAMQGHMVSPLCVLIGRPEQVGATGGSGANALDGTALWVAVTPQGKVITVENAINTAASTAAGNRAFIYGYGTGASGTGGTTTSVGGG